jgi:hypothetical protein
VCSEQGLPCAARILATAAVQIIETEHTWMIATAPRHLNAAQAAMHTVICADEACSSTCGSARFGTPCVLPRKYKSVVRLPSGKYPAFARDGAVSCCTCRPRHIHRLDTTSYKGGPATSYDTWVQGAQAARCTWRSACQRGWANIAGLTSVTQRRVSTSSLQAHTTPETCLRDALVGLLGRGGEVEPRAIAQEAVQRCAHVTRRLEGIPAGQCQLGLLKPLMLAAGCVICPTGSTGGSILASTSSWKAHPGGQGYWPYFPYLLSREPSSAPGPL